MNKQYVEFTWEANSDNPMGTAQFRLPTGKKFEVSFLSVNEARRVLEALNEAFKHVEYIAIGLLQMKPDVLVGSEMDKLR